MNEPPLTRLIEAALFAAAQPQSEAALKALLPEEASLSAILAELTAHYESRGVNLVKVGEGWVFRTAPDLSGRLRIERTEIRRLSRAAVETLAVIAYHQPVTRADIEAIRGVAVSKGTLDVLLEAGWVRPGRRRQTPGRPLTWLTTTGFLDHFGLPSLDDLPGLADLKAAGLLDSRPAMAVLPGGGLAESEAVEQPDDQPAGGESPLPADQSKDYDDAEAAIDVDKSLRPGQERPTDKEHG